MQILVVGGGGREHALVWKLAQSPRVEKIYCAPGNAGISALAECVPIKDTDLEGLAALATAKGVDLTVVGPEAPLAAGIVDLFQSRDLPCFGPTQAAARLEASKEFAKEIMRKYQIPTAAYAVFTDLEAAKAYVRAQGAPIVIKADGLAAGKGVTVALDEETALVALEKTMGEQVFGVAGAKVVIEEYLEGEEATVLAFTDGKTVIPMVPSQDHKRVFEGDEGPNTGGMGAYSPVPAVGPDLYAQVYSRILIPLVEGLAQEGIRYQGVLYAGLMLTSEGPKVVEFNCRFGDPEAQVVLPRLAGDLVPILEACLAGRLAETEVVWRTESAATVVLASGGYPGPYRTGFPIEGLEKLADREDILVFHAGTRLEEGRVVTSGGRVLAVTGLGADLDAALAQAYAGVEEIRFEGRHYRRDIGWRAKKR